MKKSLYLIVFIVALFIGCDNDESVSGKLIVHLTDSPAEYEEVLIDVQELLVHIDSGWTELPLKTTGQINLLELTNGNDILLTEETLPAGKISQMRLVLGEANELKMGGEVYDLATPSAQQSGLKFNIHTTLEPGVTYEMWIDFDAARSIVEQGNGSYSLKPTIKVFTEATSGSIVGVVKPAEAKPLVQAVSATDETTSTFADEITGEFIIRGLDEGSYKVVIKPIDGYQEVEKENIDVSIGVATDIDTVYIDQVIL